MKSIKKAVGEISFKLFDGIIIFLFIFLSFVWFFAGTSKKAPMTATVFVDGEKVFSKRLDEIDENFESSFSNCTILFEKDGATFISSDCNDKLCEKRGKLKLSGDSMACVPNKVVLILEKSDDNFDAVSY